jgi:hypothetical protein
MMNGIEQGQLRSAPHLHHNCFRLAVTIPATLGCGCHWSVSERIIIWGQPDKFINSALAFFFTASWFAAFVFEFVWRIAYSKYSNYQGKKHPPLQLL